MPVVRPDHHQISFDVGRQLSQLMSRIAHALVAIEMLEWRGACRHLKCSDLTRNELS